MPTSRDLRNNPKQILEIREISGEISGWAYHDDFFHRLITENGLYLREGTALGKEEYYRILVIA
ncbi:hypothetical protein J6TS1_39830 [Siminovitchia terrae]|uniref:Uncharacterized protein n=1 Tax=Siminovitchia terrae TaxID=1914933 RepID=A0ABQ4L1E6_SIMTE|nr:hypothetical protein J6TS1_39830 [Siminovitchia terrae]